MGNQKLVVQWDAGDGRKSRWWSHYGPSDHDRICEKFLELNGTGVVNIELSCGVFEFDFDWMRLSDKKSGETWRIRQRAEDMSAEEIEAAGAAALAGNAPPAASAHRVESDRGLVKEADVGAYA